jgi:hypothetical protein
MQGTATLPGHDTLENDIKKDDASVYNAPNTIARLK